MRYKQVNDRFEYLFNEKKIRYYYIIKQMSKEYFFIETSIMRILKTDLPDQVLPDGHWVKQEELFDAPSTSS